MVDIYVAETQNWLNATYGNRTGWVQVTVDGETGNSTVAALTRALQVELGITALSSSFGPGTLAALTTFGSISATTQTTKPNIVKIVQGAMYCKGYDSQGYVETGGLNGVYAKTVPAAKQLRTDMGVGAGDGSIAPKVFKALLTTDAAILIPGGNRTVRQIQQDLNGRYINRRDFNLMPTDGVYSRNVQTALLFALQYELGLADGVANGNFGPTTQANLRSQGTLTQGSADGAKYLVHLLQAALNFNGYPVAYDGVFGPTTGNIVSSFQLFAELSVTRAANFETWASLLVSTGDPARPVSGADCVTTITAERAATLYNAGYRIVGRYLTNTPDNIPNKNIKPGELATIFAAGLRVFPIFQTGGATPSHFTSKRGGEVAKEAFDAAQAYGFKRNTTIYFAVDWDALDQDIDSKIIPYFRAVVDHFISRGAFYRVGLYGPRNICTRLRERGLTTSSFVSGMSTGYSGNLGFPLPRDWAFDQIATVTVGSGAGQIEIDKNVVSGRDPGQSSVESAPSGLDVAFPAYVTRDYLVSRLDQWFVDNTSDNQKDPLQVVRRPAAAMQILLDHDEWITQVARQNRMRKSLIQSVILWEHAMERFDDAAADAAVVATNTYFGIRDAFEANPSGTPPTAPIELKDDSSTGLGQIFGRTAISALNWATANGYAIESLDENDWKQLYGTWLILHDERSNIRVASLVLLWGARDVGITADPLRFSADERRRTLVRYNGSGSAAERYGEKLVTLYSILEQINVAAR